MTIVKKLLWSASSWDVIFMAADSFHKEIEDGLKIENGGRGFKEFEESNSKGVEWCPTVRK